jgi:phage shock protein C
LLLATKEGDMFCTHCGNTVTAHDRFCAKCGAAQSATAVPTAARQLVRPIRGRKVAGVCLGFAYYLDLDPTLVRILWLVLTFFSCVFPGILGYIIAWILMPETDSSPAWGHTPAAAASAPVEPR